MKELTLAEFQAELASHTLRPGLLFGPGVTHAPGELATEFHKVFDKVGLGHLLGNVSGDTECSLAVDAAFEARPDKQDLLKHALLEKVRSLKPTLEIPHLVKAGWSAYVSLTEDLLLEESLRNLMDSQVSSRSVTIVDHIGVEPPLRSIPVYKLLGNLNDIAENRAVCLSDSDMVLRRQEWSGMLRTLANYLREAPIVVVGFSNSVQRMREVLAALAAQPSPRVTRLRFLKHDPVLSDPTVRAVLKKFEVAIIDASLREICDLAEGLRPVKRHGMLPATEKTAFRLVQDLTSHYDCPVSIVPTHSAEPLKIPAIEMPSCIDGLFRPSSTDWRPFEGGLDLRRDCTDDVLAAINSQSGAARPNQPKVLTLIGEAGIGKTCLAKRVALEISEESTLVLWCRRVPSGGWIRLFRAWLSNTFENLKKSHHDHYKKLVVICDDPWGLRIDASDALVALEQSHIPTVLVVVLRPTDRYVAELRSTVAATKAQKEIEIPHELSDKELRNMATMLQKIGAVTNIERANALVQSVPTKHARDILCSLWYLIPETKSQLAESLKDEYFRLGDFNSVSELAQSEQFNGRIAHKAYEYVTVSSRLDIGLPIEILVNALGIDYADWTGALENGRPLWGLLYDEMSDDGSTVVYFTRNEVVTRVLIDLVNGGLPGHMGEIRVLKELIGACRSAAVPHRNFLIDVLVRARSKLSEIYSYEQGCELYETALEALPLEDRLFEHHYGIWIQDKGPVDGSAYRQLEKALRASTPSGSDRDAPREHIQASLAATTLQQIKSGLMSWNEGSALVQHHLRLAASPTFFNAHTSHLAANLSFEAALLASQQKDQEIASRFTLDAFDEIERAFQTVGARSKTSFQYNKTLGMLGDLQSKILGLIPDTEQLILFAKQIFNESGRQTGFELAARRLLVEATQSRKGKDFNDVNNYLNECVDLIQDAGKEPAAALLSVRVDLTIRWKLHGFKENEWDIFRDDLLDILADPKFHSDVLKRFFLAVAYSHLGQTSEATAEFAQLRRESATNHRPNDIRAFFQDASGNPRRFQGNIRYFNGKGMIAVPELQADAPLRQASGGTSGESHAYIGFCFNGLVAVRETPTVDDLLLY